MIFLGLEVGSWADWLAAVGTISAVVIALKFRSDKAKIKINAEFLNIEEYQRIPENDPFGEQQIKFSDKVGDQLEYTECRLQIYISNIRESSGLITSWGIITPDGEKSLSLEPVLIKGFEVEEIVRIESIDGDDDHAIDEIRKHKNSSGKFKLYFEEVNGRKHYCSVVEQKISNKKD